MIPIEAAVERYLDRKSVGRTAEGGGTYAANAGSILGRWADWLDAEYGVAALEELERAHLKAYARYLSRQADSGEYAASTARTYFAVVRAFLSWCVEESIVPTNPAEAATVTDALPTPTDDSSSQHWSPRATHELESVVRQRANEADDGSEERLARLREYAMVALLAHAGLRGGELFRVPEDDRRNGATWDDVDFYAGTIRVLGRGHELEDVSLPAAARTPLRRYRVALDPPTTDWPLFPTRHAPSIAASVRDTLADRGYDPDEIEPLFDDATAIELATSRAIAPPAITTEGARSVLRRLCEDAGIDVDGNYLTPRGVRRNRSTESYRREATASKPTLRASVLEQSIVVPDERSSAAGGRDEPTEND